MPYENKLVFFDLPEVCELIKAKIDLPPGVSNSWQVIKLTPLVSKLPDQFSEKRRIDDGEITAVEIIMHDPKSLRSFRRVLMSETLIELMVDRLLSLKIPLPRSFTKRVLTSDFHLCLEIGNLPVQIEKSSQAFGFETSE
jgi:hypothetical protein